MAKKNIELLKRLRTRLVRMRHPQHFRMAHVAVKTECGAAMCLAGHTLELAGYQKKFIGEGEGDVGDFEWYTPSGRRVRDAMNAAQRLLGLSYDEAQNEEKRGVFLRFDLKTPQDAAKVIDEIIQLASA